MRTDDILNEKEKVYGDFGLLARAIQAFKSVYRAAPSWNVMTASQREALEMDLVKTCRILYGNPMHMDNWLDKAGYSTLAVEEFTRNRPMTPAENPKEPVDLIDQPQLKLEG